MTDDPRATGRLFDAWAQTGRAEGMEEGHLRAAAPVLAAQQWGPGMRVLDLGCGNGWASAHAHARGAHAVAVDVARQMVKRAAGRGAHALQADMQRLPFADRTFDACWSMEALYYAADPDAVLAELARVLAPGAKLTILIDHFEENPASHAWPAELGVPMVLRGMDAWRRSVEAQGFAHVVAQRTGDDGSTLVLAGKRGG